MAEGKTRVTKREAKLLAEIDALRERMRSLEERVEAMSAGTAAPRERLRTHIDGLDEALQGGIPRGHVVLVAGPSGSMKTSLAMNMLVHERRAGATVVYVSLEEGRESLRRTMERLDLKAEGDFIVDIARLRMEHQAAEETTDWLQILQDYLERRREKGELGLVVIDPLNSLYTLANIQQPRRDLFRFVNFLRSLRTTTLLILESAADGAIPNNEDFLADGVLQLSYGEGAGGKIDLRIRCLKMRHTDHARDAFRLGFDDGRFAVRPLAP